MKRNMFTSRTAAGRGLPAFERPAPVRRMCFVVTAMLLGLLGLSATASYGQDTLTCAPHWGPYGSAGINGGGTTYPSVDFTLAGVPYIAYQDGGNGGKISVSKYTGTGTNGWANVGSGGFSGTSAVDYSNLCIDDTDGIWVCYQDQGINKVVVKKFDGTTWNTVGSSFSVGSPTFIAMDLDGAGTPYVAYRDGSNQKLSVKKYNAGSWTDVGPTFVTSGTIHANARISMDFDGMTPYIAYRETNGKLSVIKYSGSAWESVGGVFTDSTDYPNLTMHGSVPYVVYTDMSAGKKTTVKKYEGGSWTTVGSAGFSHITAMWNDIAMNTLGQPVITFKSLDTAISKAHVMTFDGTSWSFTGNNYLSGAGTDYNQVYVDASGAYWTWYRDNLVSGKATLMKLTTSVLPPIVGPNFACTGSTATFSNGTAGGSWSSSNVSAGTIGTTGVFSGNATGTTNISYTLFAGCAQGRVVSVNLTPGNISGNTSAICVNGTATLTIAASGTWASGNTSIANFASPSSGIVTGVSGGTTAVTFTTTGGCTKSVIVTVTALPAAGSITGNTTVSNTITTQLSNSASGGTWSSASTGIVSINSSTGLATGGSTFGTAVISYRVSASGCTNTVTTSVLNKSAVAGLHFDGSNDYLSFTNDISSATDLTLEAWVKPGSPTNNARIFDFGSSSTANIYLLSSDGTTGKPKFVINSGGTEQSVTAATALSTTAWTHVAVTVGGGEAKLYLNGVLSATNSSFTLTPATVGATTNNVIGRSFAGSSYYAGTMDEVRIWNTARSASEILDNMNCDIAGQTGLLATYRFNNGTAGASNTSNTTAVDYSGNNRCGTLNGFTLSGTTSNYVVGALGLCNSVSTPSFNVTGTSTVCGGATVTLNTTGTGGVWSSTNTGVATVGTSGIVTGVAAGTATISYTVTTNCIATAASMVVTVTAQPAVISGASSVCIGSTTTLTTTPSAGTWSSSSPSTGSISASGVVSGIAAGNVTISYQHPTTGCYRTAEMTVNALPTAITGTTAIDIAGTTTLNSTPSSGSWVSSNTSVASINSSTGAVTGNASGTTTITYTAPTGCVTTTQLTVNLAPITGTTSTCIGIPVSLSHPVSGGTWASSATDKATVDASGVVTGVAAGTSVITYSALGLYTTVTVTVLGTTPSISGTGTLCAGSATSLSATPTSGSWSSSSSAVAGVDASTGLVSGVSAGTARITYTLGSCYSTTIVTVAAALPAITGDNFLCLGGSVTLANTGGAGTWSSSVPAKATVNSSTGVVSAVATGTTVISYITNPTCYTTATITVNAAPAAITGTSSVCVNATTDLDHATSGGTWSASNGNATVNAVSGLVTGVTAGTVTISYHTSAGCFTTTDVTVNALPAAISGAASVCEGSSVTLTNGGAGTWSSADATVTVGSGSGSVTGITAGTATITFKLNATQCYITRTQTVNALPTAISGASSVCANGTTSFTSSGTGTWASSNTSFADVDASGLVSGVAAGTANITYTESTGCQRTKAITVNALPNAITGTTSLCVGSTTTLTSSTASQTWSSSAPGVASVATASTTTGLVTANATGTAEISYTNANGCSRIVTVTVTSGPAAIGGEDQLCLGGTIQLTNATGGGTWSSSATGKATINSTTGLVSAVATGTTTISYILGATCYTTKTVSVNSAPAAITGTASVCVNGTTDLDHAVSGGTWSASNGNATVDASTGVVTGVSSGNVTISYHTSEGCFVTRSVVVNALPSAITGTSSVCEGSSVTLTGSGTGTWSSGDATVTVNSASGSVTGVTAGTATITFKLTATQCYITRTQTVNALPDAITGGSTVCANSDLALSSAPSGGAWTSSTTANATVDNSTGVVTGVAAGTSTISYTSAEGCRRTLVVTVNAQPAAITGSTSMCLGSTTTLTSSTASQTWSSSATGVATVATASATTGLVSSVSTGTAVIAYTNAAGCARTVTVTVTGAPTAITGDDEVCIGGTTTLTNSTGSGTWSSSVTSRATVNSTTGAVSGLSAGTTVISYFVSATCYTTKVMTVSTAPAAIGGPTNVCVGNNITLTHAVSGGTWSSASSNVSIVSSTGVLTGNTAGTAVVTYAVSAGCFRTTVITVNTSPSAITGTAAMCEGASTTLSGSGAGTWASGSTGIATVVTSSGVVTGVAAGNATITFTLTSTGCSTTRQVTVNALPDAISGSSSVCQGSTTTLTSNPTTGTWTSSTPANGTVGAADGVVGGVATGTTTITYTIPGGCYVTKPVTVNMLPGAITGSLSICIGSTTTLTSSTSGQTWTSVNPGVANITSTTSTTAVISGASAGVTNIRYTTGAGCARVAQVTVGAAPASITGDDDVCVGSSTTLTAAGGGTWGSSTPAKMTINSVTGSVTGVSLGTSTITYYVSATCYTTKVMTVVSSPADPITGGTSVCVGGTLDLDHPVTGGTWSSSSAARATVNATTGVVTGVGAGTVTISYYTNAGCYRTQTVTVNGLPNAIGGAGVVCEGGTTTLTNTTPGGSWANNGAFATVGSSSGIVTGIDAGTSLISYVITSTGCFSTKTVTVNAVPDPIVGVTPICAGATAAYTSSPAGGTWTSSTTTAATVSATGVVTGVAGGTSTISYSFGSGCRVTKVVTVNALPGTISGTQTMCVGGSTTLTATTASLTWSSADGAVASVAPTSSIAAQVNGLTAGTSTISYTNAAGCARTLVVTVTAAASSISGTAVVCVGGSVTLTNSGGGTWSSSATSRATINSSTGVMTGIAAGTVTITYRTSPTCFTTTLATVNTTPVDAITGPTQVCANATITLSHPVSSGNWISSNGLRASVNSSTGVVTGVSAGSVTISYYTQPGCFRTYNVTVFGAASPVSGANAVCVNGSTTLSSSTSGGTWSNGGSSNASITSTGVLTGLVAGTLTVSYTVAGSGCSSTKVMTVNPLPDPIVSTGSICVGATETYTSAPSGGTWNTSAGIYATVNSSTGVVTGVAAGTPKISYTLPTGCVRSTTVTVNALPGTISGPSSVVVGNTVTLTSTPAGGNWTTSTPALVTVNMTTGAVTAGSTPGVATIVYTNPATTCARTRTINVTPSRPYSTTSEAGTGTDIRVYPSPTSGVLNIESEVAGSFTLYTLDGRKVERYEINYAVTTIALPYNLAAGVYMCRFEGVDGTQKVVRVVYTP